MPEIMKLPKPPVKGLTSKQKMNLPLPLQKIILAKMKNKMVK